MGCGSVHDVNIESPKAGPNAHTSTRQKIQIQPQIPPPKLERFDLIEDQKGTIAIKIRQTKTLWYRFHQRKLIKLDFILSKIFKRMSLPEQGQRCSPTAEKDSNQIRTTMEQS